MVNCTRTSGEYFIWIFIDPGIPMDPTQGIVSGLPWNGRNGNNVEPWIPGTVVCSRQRQKSEEKESNRAEDPDSLSSLVEKDVGGRGR